jgi:hypothetical protein
MDQSHCAYLDDDNRPSWLTTSEMKEYFDTEGGYNFCLTATMNGSSPAPPDFDKVLFESCGGARHMIVKQPETPSSLSVESALEQVAELTGADKSEILSTKRGAGGNPARVLAMWWLVYGAGQTNTQVGNMLNITPSAVSRILKKLRVAPGKYLGGQIAKWQSTLFDKG